MLHPPKAVLTKRAQLIARLAPANESEISIPSLDSVEELLRLEPLNPFFLHAAAAHFLAADDVKTAETYVLRGMDALPHLPTFFILWQQVLVRLSAETASGDDQPLYAFELAIRKANLHFDSWMMSKPAALTDEKEGIILTDPMVVAEVAETLREKHERLRKDSGPLEQYYLFQEILDQSEGLVCIGLIEEAIALSEPIRPMVEGLLRSYADPLFEEPFPRDVAIAIVILAAIGEARHLPWILELESDRDDDIEFAASWAFHQLAKHHPDRAVAAIRDFAAECDSDFLPVLVEHLWHLRHVKYAVDILDVLLDAVPDAPAEERESMFVTIAEAMLDIDRPMAELRLPKAYREIRRKMDRRVENVLHALIDGAKINASKLTEEFINLSLDKFCAELMNEWDDFEDFTEEDNNESDGEDEFDAGDNSKIEELSPAWYDPDGRIRAVQAKIRDLLQSVITEAEFGQAFRIFSEGARDLPDDSAELMLNKDAFMDWLVYDYTSKRLPEGLVMECVKQHASVFGEEERSLLRAWAKSHLTIIEAVEIVPEKGLHVRDLFLEKTFFVQDENLSREGTKFDCSMVRCLPFGDGWILSGHGLSVDRRHVPSLIAWAKSRKKKKQTWQEFLKSNGHVLRLKMFDAYESFTKNMKLTNFEGEPLMFCEAHYEVLDKAAVVSVLEAHPALERDDLDNQIQFSWLDAPGSAGSGRRGFGMIRITGRDMVLECNSEGRLERGRKLLEQVLGGKIAHLRDKFESAEEAMRKHSPAPASKEIPEIPEEVQREIVQNYLEQHYSTWPDIPLPALKGSTPRQAAASKQLRPLLQDLLKDFINRSERERKLGQPGYDFRRLARELGFDELG